MRVYLASPLGFATATRAYLHELVGALEAHGLTVHDPWGSNRPKAPVLTPPPAPPTDPEERRAARHARNHTIGQLNAEAIQAADGVIAVLDGVDVDSGTAAEIGYAFGLGKAIWGLRTDSRLTGDNEGAIVNLQVQYFIEASGGRIARSIADLLLLLDHRELPGLVDTSGGPGIDLSGRGKPRPYEAAVGAGLATPASNATPPASDALPNPPDSGESTPC